MQTSTFETYHMIKTYLAIFICCAVFLPCAAMGEAPKEKASDNGKATSEWSGPIRFYQKTLSRADGDRCPMYPTCSHYALEAFKRYNFFSAWVLTSDRLLRCGRSETRLSKRIRTGGRVKIHDPLSANTFWWEKP